MNAGPEYIAKATYDKWVKTTETCVIPAPKWEYLDEYTKFRWLEVANAAIGAFYGYTKQHMTN